MDYVAWYQDREQKEMKYWYFSAGR